MTWHVATTAALSCGCKDHYRDGAAPTIGDHVECPYCHRKVIVKATFKTRNHARG